LQDSQQCPLTYEFTERGIKQANLTRGRPAERSIMDCLKVKGASYRCSPHERNEE
jgi:hypothetical protein